MICTENVLHDGNGIASRFRGQVLSSAAISISPRQTTRAQAKSMESNAKYFITQSNLRQLVYRANVVERNISSIYDGIYGRIDLSDYISEKEAQNLHALGDFLEKSEDYLIEVAVAGGIRPASSQSSPFVFASGAPKYHKNEFCETLTRDFENFKIPTEIDDRGPEAVSEFREFAAKNRRLLNDGREDVFVQKLKNHFGLASDIDRVSFSNSGRTKLVENGPTEGLEQLSSRIRAVVDRIELFRKTEQGTKVFRSHIFAPPARLLQAHQLNSVERDLLQMKKELVDLVTEFVIRKRNPEGSVFSQRLLEVYGLEACGVCCDKGFDLK